MCYPLAPILAYLRTPADNQRGPQHAEHLLADLMQANTRRLAVSLLHTAVAGETVLAWDVASPLLTPATRALVAHYPGVSVTGPGKTPREEGTAQTIYLRLIPDVRSLRTTVDFEDRLARVLADPASGLLSAVADRHDGLHASIRFSLSRITPRERRRAKRVAKLLTGPLSRWLPSLVKRLTARANGTLWERFTVWPLRWLPVGEPPTDSVQKLDGHLFRVAIELRVIAPRDKNALARKRLLLLAAAFAPFTVPGIVTLQISKRKHWSLLSAPELAAMWHLPVNVAPDATMRTTALPYLPPPVELPVCSNDAKSLPLGLTAVGPQRLVGIAPGDRLHQLVIGKSGMGKSTLLHMQIAADMTQAGVGLIDPHGDLVEDVLNTIPRHRTNDVVLIDPTNASSPTINPLACRDPSQRALVAENNLAALSKVFGFDEGTAPRLLHILRYALLALVGTAEGNYQSIRPMLTDKQFRQRIVSRVEDAEVRSFWIDEVGRWSQRYEQEAMPAILNKIGQFTAHPQLRRMFGDQRSIDLREMMDAGKIVLVSLSQGKLGEQAARFAGSMIMASFQNAAMTRADTERSQRKPFYLYADEYATFVNSSFADLLAQSRKYGLFLTAAQQIVSQVDEPIMDAMFGNLATLVVFQVAQKDAERLALELASDATPADLMRLPKYHAVVRTAIAGVPSRPFVIQTLPPPTHKRTHADPAKILANHRHRYGPAA